jgi:hypothetical protein
VILEDNKDRQQAMRECLADRFYQFESQFFDDSATMIEYLDRHLPHTAVIALDHDLELQEKHGVVQDPGTGRDVAEFLAGKTPVCPVVFHSTNSDAVAGMERVLSEAGWETDRVIPWGDMEWIAKQWFRSIRRAIVRPSGRAATVPND